MNNVSLELYEKLMEKVPEMIKERGMKNKVTIDWDTFLLCQKFKNAFDQIEPISKTMLDARNFMWQRSPQPPPQPQPDIQATNIIGRQVPPNNNAAGQKVKITLNPNMPADVVVPEESIRNFDDFTWLNYIEFKLSLPGTWIQKESDLLKPPPDNAKTKTSQSWMRIKV